MTTENKEPRQKRIFREYFPELQAEIEKTEHKLQELLRTKMRVMQDFDLIGEAVTKEAD